MPLEDFIIRVYCLIAHEVEKLYSESPWRSRGFTPKLTDAEVLTLEIVGSYLGIDTDKGVWQYFKSHWLSWFPNLPSRTTFVRQSANLWKIKQRIREELLLKLNAYEEDMYRVDGFPMPVCNFRRAPIAQCFKAEASYGYCRAKHLSYYGFHGHIVVNKRGVITGFTLTAANVDERKAVWDMLSHEQGYLFADKGYVSRLLSDDLKQEQQLTLFTPNRKRYRQKHPQWLNRFILNVRKRVETAIGQLAERFAIQRVRARDMWHHTSRIYRVLLAHTVAAFINLENGAKSCVAFDGLIS